MKFISLSELKKVAGEPQCISNFSAFEIRQAIATKRLMTIFDDGKCVIGHRTVDVFERVIFPTSLAKYEDYVIFDLDTDAK